MAGFRDQGVHPKRRSASPQFAADYYGPNEGRRQSLATGANTWQPVRRLAVKGHLSVRATCGQLRQECPLVVALDPASQRAVVEISGGVAYVPVTFTGLDRFRGWSLYQKQGGQIRKLDQSVLGHDFWQVDRDDTGTYRMTFNVLLDTPGDEPGRTRLLLRAD